MKKQRYYYKAPDWWGTVARLFHAGEQPNEIQHDGTTCFLCGGAGSSAVVGVGSLWEIDSYGAGCVKSQVPEFQADSVKIGIPTEFDKKTGQAKFTSRQHRKQYMAAKGLVDNEGGYGDYTGQSQPLDGNEG